MMRSLRRRIGSRGMRILCSAIGITIVVCYLFPVYWMFASSVKTSAEIFANPPSIIPSHPTLAAFRQVFESENVVRYMRNSLAIAIPVTVVTLLLGASGSYALSRLRTRLIDVALVLALILQIFPDALLATPMFIMFRHVGLLNTFTGVVFATSAKSLAFALVILRPMYRQVPAEIEEASRVDGCGTWQTFWRIVLPIMRVPLIVVGVLSFVQAYGQFVYPLTLLSKQELQPATVGIYSFIGAEYADWDRVMAFASIFAIPVLILFLLLQRKIVAGLTAGALK
jgi:multiple sugar transport system permease protein